MRRLLLAALALAALALPASASTRGCKAGSIIFTVAQGGGASCTSLQQCLNSQLPKRPVQLANNYCFKILDSALYFERVEVLNVDTNGHEIFIGTITSGPRPTFAPIMPSTFGVFNIAAASVTIEGINIRPNFDPYGIHASSAYVEISSVNVTEVAGLTIAGISITSYSAVMVSSVSVTAVTAVRLSTGAVGSGLYGSQFYATGVQAVHLMSASTSTLMQVYAQSTPSGRVVNVVGGGYNTISQSTMTNNNGASPAVEFNGSGYNQVSGSFVQNGLGRGLLFSSSNNNTVSASTITTAGTSPSLEFGTSVASNTVTNCSISNTNATAGAGVSFMLNSNRNKVVGSTVTNKDSGYAAVEFYGSRNTLSASRAQSESGWGVKFDNSDLNLVEFSTATSGGVGEAALYVTNSDSNTVDRSFLQSTQGYGIHVLSGSRDNAVVRSTAQAAHATYQALYVVGSDTNTFTRSYFENTAGGAVLLDSGADRNVIAFSTVAATNAIGAIGVSVAGSDYNRVSDAYVMSAGHALQLAGGADFNTVERSTMAAAGNGAAGLRVSGGNDNEVYESHMQSLNGAGASFNGGASSNYVEQSTMVSASGADYALHFDDADGNWVTFTYIQNNNNTAVYVVNGSSGNWVTESGIVGGGSAAVYVASSSGTYMADNFVFSTAGSAVRLDAGAHWSNVDSSTLTSNALGMAAYVVQNATFNLLSNSYVQANSYSAARFVGADNNAIESSELYSFGTQPALSLSGSSSNTIETTWVEQASETGDAVRLEFDSNYNRIIGTSVLWTNDNPSSALYVQASSATLVEESYLYNFAGTAARLLSDARVTRIDLSTMVVNNATGHALRLNGADGVVVTGSYMENQGATAVYLDGQADGNTLDQNLVQGVTAIWLFDSSTNTLSRTRFQGTTGVGIRFESDSSSNTVDGSTATAGTGALVMNSSTNTFVRSVFTGTSASGLQFDGGSANNTVSLSSASGVTDGVYIVSGASNTITQSFVTGNNTGVYLYAFANSNLVSYSTVTNSNAVYGAVQIEGTLASASYSNRVANSYVFNATGDAVSLPRSRLNTVSQSALVSMSSTRGSININGSTDTLVTDSYLVNPNGMGLVVTAGSLRSVIARSTITASYVTGAVSGAARVILSSGTTIHNSYVYGSTGVFVQNSSETVVGASTLISTGTGAAALSMTGTSVNLSLSSSVLRASSGAGFSANGAAGRFALSTNTIEGAFFAVSFGTAAPGAQIHLTSNTILPRALFNQQTFGLLLNGLAAGAVTSVTNNSIYYRVAGAPTGAPGSATAFEARTSGNVTFDRNRINMPGSLGAATNNFTAVRIQGGNNVFMRYNDVRSTVTLSGGTGHLLKLGGGSSNVTVRNNVFSSSFTAGVSSGTVLVEPGSNAGLSFDYNDYHSHNAFLAFSWIGSGYNGLAAWRTASGHDANSISADPLWNNVNPGTEDFHPRSTVGRYDPAISGFVADADSSPTIDAADPIDDEALEPDPDGPNCNQGSYGCTAEASMTGRPMPGCALTRNVGDGQQYATITAALASVTGPLTGHTCVVVEDSNTYNETVTVANFVNNGSSLTITSRDPSAASRPRLNPSGSFGFRIMNASVNVSGIDVRPNGVVDYGVYASSGWVNISSMAFSEAVAGGDFDIAAVRVSSWSRVTHVDADVSADPAHGLMLESEVTRTEVAYSTFIANSASHRAARLFGASTNTLTAVYLYNAGASALFIGNNANYNTVTRSTMGSSGGGQYAAELSNAHYNALSYSSFTHFTGNGVVFQTNASYNALTYSTITAGGAAHIILNSASSNTITDIYAEGSGNNGLYIINNSAYNAVLRSTFSLNAGGAAAYIDASSRNTLDQVVAVNDGGYGLRFVSAADDNRVLRSSFSADGNPAMSLQASAGNLLLDNYAYSSTSHSFMLADAADMNTVSGGTFASNSGALAAFYVGGASSNTVGGIRAYNPFGFAGYFAAAFNTTVSSSAFYGGGGNAPLHFVDGASNTVTGSFASNTNGYAAYFANSTKLTVAQSTFTNNLAIPGLMLDGVSSSTLSGVLVISSAGARLLNSGYNTLSLSSFSAYSIGERALDLQSSSWNVISAVYAANPDNGTGVRFQNSSYNTVVNSTIASRGMNYQALHLGMSSTNTFTATLFVSTTQRVVNIDSGSNNNSVALSTITGAEQQAVSVSNSALNRVTGSYIAASTGVYLNMASSTTLAGNRIAALTVASSRGCGVVSLGGGNLYVSTNIITSDGDGVCLDSSNSGRLDVTSNVVTVRGYGVRMRSQGAGTQVWVSTNTIYPLPGFNDGGGFDVDGLTTGATIYNNSIYYRATGGAAGTGHFGLRAKGSAGLLIARNRINMPGMLTGGSFDALSFQQTNSPGIAVLFNDVHVKSAAGVNPVYLLRTENPFGGTLYVKNNIFSSDVVAASSYTIYLMGGGLQSNYNVFHSSTGVLRFHAGGSDAYGLAAWVASSLSDAGSTEGNPHWQNVSFANEDFHVKSTAGRFDPVGQTFVTGDTVDSASIDAADPAEPYGAETAPNGFHANAGSTGGTAEASRSAPQACAVLRKVCKTGGCPYTSIQTAVNSLPDPLPGYSCISIRDTSIYTEMNGVVVSTFTLNGSSISIAVDPAFSTGAVLQLGGGAGASAILDIRVASVTVSGLELRNNGFNIDYGVRVSSPNVTLSSMSVYSSGGSGIQIAGIALSTESTLTRSTIVVTNDNASALVSSGSWVRISHASMTWTGATAGPPLFRMTASSGSTVSDLYVRTVGMKRVAHFADADNTTVTRATFTTSSGDYSLYVASSDALAFSQLVLNNQSNYALYVGEESVGVSVDRASITAAAPTNAAVQLNGTGHVLSSSVLGMDSGSDAALSVRGSEIRLDGIHVTARGDAVRVLNSTAVVIANSRLHGGVFNPSGKGLSLSGGGGGHEVLDSTMTTYATAGGRALEIIGVSSNTVARAYIHNTFQHEAFYIEQSTGNYISQSTVTNVGGLPAFYLFGASSNVITGLHLQSMVSAHALYFDSGSNGNVIVNATITARGSGMSAVSYNFASSNTISYAHLVSTGYVGVNVAMNSNSNSITRSSVSAMAGPGIYLQSGSSLTVSESYVWSPSDHAIYAASGSDYLSVVLSTFVTGSSAHSAFEMNGATAARVERSVVLSTGSLRAVHLTNNAHRNVFDQTVVRITGSGGVAFRVAFSTGNVFTRGFAISPSTAMVIEGHDNRVTFSTVAAGTVGVYLGISAPLLSNSSVEASTAVHVYNTSSPRVLANKLTGLVSNSDAVIIEDASNPLFSSNVVTGAPLSAAVSLSNNSGVIRVSTNTFLPGPMGSLYVGEQQAGASLWITSNTILPTIGASSSTYGLYFDGLTRGATVQNNDFYYRTTGSLGAAFVTYGLYAQDSPNLRVDHNRYSNPNVLTGGGGAAAFSFHNSNNLMFVYNDVYSGELSNTAPYLLNLDNSLNAYVSGNIMVSSMTGTGTAAIFNLPDSPSETSLRSDYNDLYSKAINSRIARVTGSPLTFAQWQASFNHDLNSISSEPMWYSTAAASEDFHPLSAAQFGRYNPATAAFVQDVLTSPTIDRANPGDAVGAEGAPGTSRANLGSYGQTAEASRAAPPSGCVTELTVPSPYFSIQDAVSSLSTLTGDTCIVVRQPGTPHSESDVSIAGITTGGYRLYIMGEPNVPTVINSAFSGTAGFVIDNDSVTLKDLILRPSLAIVTGVRATGADVHITSVSIDAPSTITGWGVRLSTRAVVQHSSITVSGTGIELVGSGATVLRSSVATLNALHKAVDVNGASGAALTNMYARGASTAVYVGAGAMGTTVTGSTFTGLAGAAFMMAASSRAVVSGAVLGAPQGVALRFETGAYDNAVLLSSVTGALDGVPAVLFDGASSNTVSGGYVDYLGTGRTVVMRGGSRLNTLSQLFILGHSPQPVVEVVGASSNTLSDLRIHNPAGDTLHIVTNSHHARVERSTVTSDANTSQVLYVDASSGVTLSQSYFYNATATGYGAQFVNAADHATIERSTIATAGSQQALFVSASSYTYVTRSLVRNFGTGGAIRFANVHDSRIELSTATSGTSNNAVYVASGRDAVVTDSFISGGQGLRVDNVLRTRVHGSDLRATTGVDSALEVDNASSGLTLTANVFTAGSTGAGVRILPNNSGVIIIATNTVRATGRYGVFVATQTAGTKVYITSNTVLPLLDAGMDTYGIILNGLRTGATIQDNSVYYRTSGSMGSFPTFGIYALSSEGVLIERNRVSNPGMITAGTNILLGLQETPNAIVRGNDLALIAPTALNSAHPLAFLTSSGAVVTNNVLSASMVPGVATATLYMDGATYAVVRFGFNIFHSSNSRNTLLRDGIAYEYPWGGGLDADAMTVLPHWPSLVPGAEDFHPRSHAGRYDPTTGGFVNDTWTSGSLDRGDYDQGVGDETSPNGGQINMGSYGGTAQASRTPAAPISPAVASVHASSVSVSFAVSGAPGHTVVASTVSNFSGLYVSSSTQNGAITALAPQGLTPNTTYHFVVGANWGDAFISAGPSFSTPTLTTVPSGPSAFAFPSVHHTSATVAWQPNGNPVGITTYTVTFTTSVAFPNLNSANVSVSTLTKDLTPDATAYVTGLTPNTTYFAYVAGVNHAGVTSAYRLLGSTATRANAPVYLGAALTFSNVTDQTFDVAWGANGNPVVITTYTVEASSDSVFDASEASITVTVAPAGAPIASFSGLVPGGTYYLRVAAVGHDGVATPYALLGSTVMLPLQIASPVPVPVASVSTYSLTATWGLVSNATGYTLVASTKNVNPPTELVGTTSATFGVNATTATVFGLLPNTTHYLFVRAHGFTSNSAYAVFSATATLPAAPEAAVTTFTAVEIGSFTVSWSAAGNPLARTTYTVVASTASDFNAFASSVTLSTVPASGPTATLSGLSAYTTYYVRVRALGQGVQASAFTVLGATQTLPVILPAPVPGTTGVSASTMSATWSLVTGATGYTLVASTQSVIPPANVVASSIVAGEPTLAASVFGLSPNTTYFLFVRADGPGFSSPYAVFAATATDPAAPVSAASTFTAVAGLSASVNWQQGVNPVGVTTYTVTLSTTPAFPNSSAGNQTLATVPAGASASLSIPGLSYNTTYYAFVAALSHAGVPFGRALGSTATLANAPAALPPTFAMVGITSVTVRWDAAGNPDVTTYTVTASTASDFNAFASSVSLSTAPGGLPSATLTGLAFGTTWYFGVRAVNHNSVPTAFTVLDSTYTNLSNQIPLITDFQSGDDTWRRVSTVATYDIRFADASSLHLDKVQVRVSTTPGGGGTDLVPYTDLITGMSPLDSYATPFQLTPAIFNAMLEGVTNYVSVRVFNLVPATNTIVDAFYVLKDTTPPTLVNSEAGGDPIVQIAPGRLYDVDARDSASGLDQFQYSVSLTPGSGDATLIGWTDIAPLSGATYYTTGWTVDFASLRDAATNYVSVRAVDLAGGTSVYIDAFRVLKDTTGPVVSISTPNVATGFVSVPTLVEGGATGTFGVAGTEVSVQINPPAGLYWNGASFSGATPTWLPAVGTSSWTVTLAVPFTDSTAYRIVARSSTTYGQYSTVYATASFTVDLATPTVGVTAPVPLSTVASLPIISGTAADPGGAPSGVASIEVRLQRLSDGQWWNWFTDAWGLVPVSSASAGPATWSVTPSAALQGSLASGASFYIAVRATDASSPAHSGDFFAQGSTFTFNDPTPPAAVSDLAGVNGPLPGEIQLSWTAQGAHGATGVTQLGQYAIFYATYTAAPASTSTAQVLFSTGSVAPGAAQSRRVSGLTAGTTYFLRVAMSNADGNWSAFSNEASTTATPAPSNSILGHVVNSSTQGITAVRVDAFDTNGLLVATAFTLADGSGTFSVNGLTAGNYKIEASWTANGITSSVWQDGIAMGSVNVDFSLDINYALATLTGTLGALTASGQAGLGVAGSGYRPSAEGSRIELFQGGREVARAGVGPTGRWTIGHLLPGSYAVRAYTGLGYTDFVDVNLAEGEIRTVGFVFNPLPEASVFAFPNPARHSTTIRFETALQPLEAQIAIFDLKGALVREVPGNQIVATATPGLYHYVWDLTNSRGQGVASGVYLFMVKVKGGSENQLVKVVKKLAVVR